MVSFINMFLSYFLLFLISIGIIVCAVLLGKKLRDMRDAARAQKAEAASPQGSDKA